MRRPHHFLVLVLFLGFALTLPAAADGPFRPVGTAAEAALLGPAGVRATAARPFHFDAALFADAVRGVAVERPDQVGTPSTLLELPHPDGGLVLFRVIESPVMAPELAAKYPQIRTFRGEGLDDPTASVRFDVSPRGFRAMVLSAFGAWYVEPWTRDDRTLVASFFRRDALRDPESPFECGVPDAADGEGEAGLRSVGTDQGPAPLPLASAGPTLRTYRLALATTGEYSVAVCGPAPTKPCVAAELVTAMNRVNGIYEREVAVRMTLVGSNDLVIYLNGATDPYENDDGIAMLGQNQSNLDSVIGSANYDVGHVFSTDGGGVASLRVICSTSDKARGVTGQSNPTGDPFWVDYVAHEMGHQYGGNHTFNGNLGSCSGGNRNGSTAYEPGSGSTIMAYAGICGAQNLQPNSDPYFHGKSFDEIVAHVTTGGGASCAAATATGNSAPAVEAGAAYTIPSRTPFALTGSATDPEGDGLVFGWEQFDLGAVESGTPLVDDGTRPIFRSFNPTVVPTRTFPRLSDVLAGTTTFGETLPTTSRTMTFRLTVRDNRGGGGGVDSDTTTVASVAAAGPFAVTAPASAVTWAVGSTQTVSWSVAGSNLSPVSCANVAISLSTNNGTTFPTTLLASTPNDGTEAITVPATPTAGSTARVKVACAGNVFFAISRPAFTIAGSLPPPTVSAISPTSGPIAGGTLVTVTGTGFVAGATVTIGGVPATSPGSPAPPSPTQIKVVTGPSPAGTVDVVVTNPDGATGTKAAAFTYVAGGGSALLFHPVTPCRIVDTRNQPDGPLSGPILGASPAERVFAIAPGCGIPADARVVSANVTVTGGSAAGDLRFYPAGTALPVATTISFGAGRTRANNAMLLVSEGPDAGRVTVRNDSAAPIHLVVDVNGYFR